MDIGVRVEAMGKRLVVVGAVTAILAIGGIIGGIGPAGDDHTYGYSRIALGLFGVVGAAVLFLGKDHGKTGLMIIMAWAAIQSVYIAELPDGNYTRQLFDGLLGFTNETTVNGETTDYSAIGLNFVGLVMLGSAYSSRDQILRWRNRSATTAAA